MTRAGGRGGVMLLALLAALAAGCKRRSAPAPEGPPPPPPDVPPRLGSVSVQDFTPEGALPAGVRLEADALAAEVRERLRASGVFSGEADAGEGAVARVRVELAMEEVRAEKKAAARAAVRFRVETRPAGAAQPHWNDDVQAGAETTYELQPTTDRQAIFTRLATRTVGDLVDAYVARQRLWQAPPAELRKTLTADAGELQMEAIRAVAERRLASEVPALLALLSHPEEPVRDAALGALVELRERRAVTELARQRSMRDRREMRKIIDAIATLGGDEAIEYLGFVAEGHDDPEIRQMARRALERLRRRADAGR